MTYAPVLHELRHPQRAVAQPEKRGERTCAFQLDSAEIYAQGLRFFPLCYVPEVCIPFHAPKPGCRRGG